MSFAIASFFDKVFGHPEIRERCRSLNMKKSNSYTSDMQTPEACRNEVLLVPGHRSARKRLLDARHEITWDTTVGCNELAKTNLPRRHAQEPSNSCERGVICQRAEVHRRSCSEDIHMEEEKVEVKVQEEEVEDGRQMKSAK